MTRASSRIKKAEEKKVEPKNEEKEADLIEDEEVEDDEDNDATEENGEEEEEEGDDNGEEENAENGEAEQPKFSEEERAVFKEENKAISEMDPDNMTIDEILKLKMKLNDGSENFIFSRGPKYDENKWPVNCHLCRLGNLFTDEHIRHHLKGRGHKNKLRFRLPIPKYYNEPFLTSVPKEFEKEKPIKIYPGEFIEEISEEYQDRVLTPEDFAVKPPKDDNLIQTLSKEKMHEYNTKLPLMGMCYIYKMMGFRGVTYYCTLCDTNLKGEGFKHIVSSDHQFKYIKRHFRHLSNDVHKKLKELREVDNLFSERNIFRKLYRKIENIKGQKKITICDADDFFKNKKRYLLKTRFDEHYDETSILITDQEIDVLIRKCKNHMEFIKPDLISLENPSLGYRMSFRDEKAGRQLSDRDRDNDRRRDDDYNNVGSGRGGGGGGAGWYDYFQIMDREVDDLNHQYRNYERSPRSHPKYEIEYQRFRNGQKRGDKREFHVPFNTYWKRRLRILYDTELDKRKQRVKRQLGLRMNARTPSPPRRDNYGGDNMQGGGYGSGGRNLGYDGNDNYGNQGSVPGLRELMSMMNQQSGGNSGHGGNYGVGMGGDLNSGPSESSQIQQNEPLGVISVLRLFTAVENQLGSLGPQAVQLLSRAVIVEKNGQNPNDLMMEKDFYIFFATAREKLKGQYIANTIPTNLMSAAKKIIQDSTTLMEMFEDYCKRTGKSLPDLTGDSQNNMGGNSGNLSQPMWKGDQGGQLGGGGGGRYDNDYYNGNGNNSSNNDNRGGGFGGGMTNQNYGYSSAGYSTSNTNNGFHNGNSNSGYNSNQNQIGNRWN